MFKKKRVWAFVVFGALVLDGAFVLTAGKPPADIKLRASFEAQTDLGIPCNILNDAKGPYVTDKNAVNVWITGDVGDLLFKFEHHSGRSMRVIFPYFYSPSCGWLPDTTGLYPDLPDTPVDFFRFRTRNSPAYWGPQLNFLTMTPGQHYIVRLWVTICTTVEHYFLLLYNVPDPAALGGLVDVVAYGSPGKLVRWEMTPLPGTDDIAYIKKWPEGNDQAGSCYYTSAPMPFKLILERL